MDAYCLSAFVWAHSNITNGIRVRRPNLLEQRTVSACHIPVSTMSRCRKNKTLINILYSAAETLPASLSRKFQYTVINVGSCEAKWKLRQVIIMTYESRIDVGTECRTTFLAVGTATAAYIERHDYPVTFLEDLEDVKAFRECGGSDTYCDCGTHFLNEPRTLALSSSICFGQRTSTIPMLFIAVSWTYYCGMKGLRTSRDQKQCPARPLCGPHTYASHWPRCSI